MTPSPWHPGVDWELYGKAGEKQTAVAYRRDQEMVRLVGRQPLLGLRMRLWHAWLNR